MSDLISKQEVLNICEKAADTCREIYTSVLDKVGHGESESSAFGACAYFMRQETMYRHEIPSILNQAKIHDAAPVVHGRWLQKLIRGEIVPTCSECGLGTGTTYEYDFCPNCGAKMEVQ